MIKNKLIIFSAIIFLAAALNFISAQTIEYPQCCTLANNGAQCVAVPAEDCAGNFAPTSCDNVPSCQKGVCVNIESGECVENTPKSVCENSGGLFKNEEMHNIPECQRGCCILGQDTLFSTEVACKEAASKEGLSFNFREDIKTSSACLGLSLTDEEGACIVKTEFETKCKRTTGKECGAEESESGFASLLDKYVSGTNIATEFHQGMLCTADELKTDCTKSQKTTCYKDDVYYLDTCGNRANVFNSAKYNNPLNSDYWTYIQEPSEVCSSVVGGTQSAKTCGNCDYSSSSKCRTPQAGDVSPANQQANFENICGDLRCKYNGKTYQNTESWCAQTPGTPWQENGPGIEMDLNGNYLASKEKMFDPLKYNLPGSEYVVQECYEGEVLDVPCKGQREQICKQYEQQGRTRAVCEINNAKSCFSLKNPTKDKCNAIDDCYWLSGNSPIIGGSEDEGAVWSVSEEDYKTQGLNAGRFSDSEREQKQGSCVPLFAPGNEFWTEDGQAYCNAAQDNPRRVIYEVQLLQDRSEFITSSEKSGEKWSYDGKEDTFRRQTRCSGNCFAIPNFGGEKGEFQEGIRALWDGKKWEDWKAGMPVSDRKGQYCHKKDKPEGPKAGQVIGTQVDCIDTDEEGNSDGGKRYNRPEFYTHLSWLKFIGIRARASGDCGITTNFAGESPSYDSEKITTMIQKVKQDQSSVKEKWKGEVIEGILYKGEDLADLNNPKFNGAIYPESTEDVV